jgi:exodeoxyribonuclease-3
MVIAGDFNVIPAPEDVYNPSAWMTDALFAPQTRAHFQSIVNLGLTDAFRACHDEPHRFTFWDYQAGAFQKNQGLRIDHLLLSPQAADRLQACEIDASPRSWEKPSDHVPIYIELAV